MHGEEDDEDFYPAFTPNGARPTLQSSCARAATAAEARFRVPYPNALPRASRVIALDRGAAQLMHEISEEPWRGAHFLILAPVQPALAEQEVRLTGPEGAALTLTDELRGADLVVMIATTAEAAREAAVIGQLAREAAVMTAGIVAAGAEADPVVRAMRPSVAVLVIATEADYLPAMLSALRA